jgi:dsRNA-specific ribonuclease
LSTIIGRFTKTIKDFADSKDCIIREICEIYWLKFCMNRFAELENNLNVQFKDYSLLMRALTHRSYLNEHADEVLEDNERLEFLGDAVLDFIVGAYLYHRFPEMDEGELTSLRAALVRAKTLAGFARRVGNRPFSPVRLWRSGKRRPGTHPAAVRRL